MDEQEIGIPQWNSEPKKDEKRWTDCLSVQFTRAISVFKFVLSRKLSTLINFIALKK